jgi:hypothetical protein
MLPAQTPLKPPTSVSHSSEIPLEIECQSVKQKQTKQKKKENPDKFSKIFLP